MARGYNSWTGPIVEEAIERVKPGVWRCVIPYEGEEIRVSIVKSEAFGSYLVVAGGAQCHDDFERLIDLAPVLASGVLICIEYSDDAVPALEVLELRTIVDEADEVIVTGPDGNVIWDRLSNKRFRAVDEMDILNEVFFSMQKLDFLTAQGTERLVATTPISPTQSASSLL